jgi:tol-pal system protein YbgF
MTAVQAAIRSSLIFLVLVPLTGCGSLFRQPANVEVTRTEVEAMHQETREMMAILKDLEARIDQQTEGLASLRADNNSQLGNIEQKLEILRAQLEEQGVRFERMQRRAPAPTPDFSPEVPGTDPGDPGAGGGGVGISDELPAGTAVELYEAARRDLLSGKYDLAIMGFQDMLRAYPDSDRSDNAQYWIGEAYYSQGNLDQAIQEFLKVRDLFPESDKVAAATLKTGYCFLRKGDAATARRYFETVTREFPTEDEARLAQEKLDSIR